MRRILLLLAASVLIALPWGALDYLDEYSTRDQEARDLRAWEGSSLALIGQIQSDYSIEKQYERIAGRLRDRMNDLLDGRPGKPLDPGLLARIASQTFPADLPSPAVYLFERAPGNTGWRTLKAPGLASRAARLMEPVVDGLVRIQEGADPPKELNNKCRGLFGQFLSLDTLGKIRVGRVSPGTFVGQDVWIYWNTLRSREAKIGVVLLLLPRKTPHSLREGLDWILRHWPHAGRFPFFVHRHAPAGDPVFLRHPALNGHPGFLRREVRLARHLAAQPLGRASRFGSLWCIRHPLAEDKPLDICLVGRPTPQTGTLAGKLLRAYRACLFPAVIAILLVLLGSGELPQISVRTTFFVLLLFIAGIPLLGGLLFGLQRAQGRLDRLLFEARDETLALFQRLDAAGDHQKELYQRTLNRIMPRWTSGGNTDLEEILADLWRAFREAGQPLVAALVFDRNGDIRHRFGETITRDSARSMIDYFQDWTTGGFLELEHGANAVPVGDDFAAQRTRMFQHLIRTLNPYRSTASLIMASLGQAEGVSLADARLYQIHQAVIRNGRVEAFVFILWRPDRPLHRFLQQALSGRNTRSADGTVCAVWNDQERLAPVAPPASDRFWTSPGGRQMMAGFREFLARRTGFSETRGALDEEVDLTVQPSYTSPSVLFGGVTPLAPIRAAIEAEERLVKGGLLTLGILVLVIGWAASQRLLEPIREMEGRLRAVSRGDLDQALAIGGNREFVELSASFNAMIDGLRERRNLSRFVSGSLAADLLSSISPGGVGLQRRGTVLVSDIRKFTTLAERFPPDQVVGLLNCHLDVLAQEVHAQGGFVDKFIGDAIVAVFFDDEKSRNPTMEGPSHAVRAVRAAMGMRRRAGAIQAQRMADGLFSYEFGIGIATGELVALTIGKALQRWEHQVIGLPVQQAETLEGLSKLTSGTRIVCGEGVRQACPGLGFDEIAGTDAWELVGPVEES